MAKISIKLANKGKTNFDLSSRHKTTTDFGQLQVSNIIPVVPNDSFNVSLASEARFAPLVVPTFMQAKLVTRAFYVPMSAIYQPFENFYTDKQDSTAYKTLPSFTNRNVVDMFLNRENGLVRFVGGDEIADFVALNADSNERRCIFTEKGRLLIKLFESLGYSFNWTRADETSMSLLPILAFARICYDYIYPSQYLDGLGLMKFFKITSSDDMSACFGDNSKIVAFFLKVCDLLTLPYKQDYFTASWQSLNSPGTSAQAFSLSSPALDGESVFSDSSRTYLVNSDSSYKDSTIFSQFGLNLLSRVYDFVTRNNIVGTRYADQIFSKFGIGSRKSDPDMAQFIGQSIQPIRVVDVTAMTSADNQDLGDLGGKAYLQGKDKLFSFDSSDEFGYIICLSFVMPEVGYYQGRKRWTTCSGRFDFYNPEFDMQMRAIRNDELFADYRHYSDYTNGQLYGGNPSNRFSFAPNYSEYKKGEDFITGDFRVPSLRKNLDSYYLMRDIKVPSVENPLALNANFLFCKQHEFDKIFAQMYTLRLNITHVPNDNLPFYLDLILRDGIPIVLWYGTAIDAEDTVFWILNKDVDGTIFVNQTSSAGLGLFGITTIGDGQQASWVQGVDNGGSAHVIKFTIASVNFCLTNSSTLICLNTDNYVQNYYDSLALLPASNSETHATPIDYDEFLMNWQDYIDHIYLDHHFDIMASRSMVPISEEFMIEDGGNKVGVDMNGNRIV